MTVRHESPVDASVGGSAWQRRLDRLPRYGWAGVLVALLLAGSSFTPSLLPRSAILQGLVAGIAGAFGYGVGEFFGWAVRRLRRRRPSDVVQRRAWQVLCAVGAVFAS